MRLGPSGPELVITKPVHSDMAWIQLDLSTYSLMDPCEFCSWPSPSKGYLLRSSQARRPTGPALHENHPNTFDTIVSLLRAIVFNEVPERYGYLVSYLILHNTKSRPTCCHGIQGRVLEGRDSSVCASSNYPRGHHSPTTWYVPLGLVSS